MKTIDFILDEYCVGYDSNGQVKKFNSKAILDDPRGLSGTELNMFGNALAMGLRGYGVRIFSCFSEERRIGNVEFVDIGRRSSSTHGDVSIAYHNAQPLLDSKSKLNIVSEHTFDIPSPQVLSSGNVHVCLSPTRLNLEYLRKTYAPNLPWFVLPNACDLGKFKSWNPVKGRLLFHTSAERGLHLLLQSFPEIRCAVPEARIRFIGRLDYLNVFGRLGPRHDAIAKAIKSGLEENSGFVDIVPRKSRNAVLEEISECAVLAYPCDPPIPCEVSPISIMECLTTGLPVVLMPSDGIEELYGDSVQLVKTIKQFTEETIDVLQNSDKAAVLSKKALFFSKSVSFEKSSETLQWIINQHLDEVQNVIQIESKPIKQKRFAFTLTPMFAGRPFDPNNLLDSPRGLTGSDKAFFMLAREFARAGHEVVAFSNYHNPGEFENVKCIPWSAIQEHHAKKWDGVIAINDPRPLADFKDVGIRYFNQQCNDFLYCLGWENYTDVASCPSQTHLDYLKTLTSFNNWFVLPDGCDLTEFTDGPRTKSGVIHASSPDRGLHWLLEMWPTFRKAVPDATLDIYYEWISQYEHVKNDDGVFSLRYRMIKDSIERCAALGVKHHGSASCREVARAMSTSRLMLYPCDTIRFTEGFSVTTLECAAAGCVPVIIGVDALSQIYGKHFPVIPPPYIDHHKQFREVAISLIRDDKIFLEVQAKGRELAAEHMWEKIASKLQEKLT